MGHLAQCPCTAATWSCNGSVSSAAQALHQGLASTRPYSQRLLWPGSRCLCLSREKPWAWPVSLGSTPAPAAAPRHTQARARQPTFPLSLQSNLPRTFPPRSQNKANSLFITPSGWAGLCTRREHPMVWCLPTACHPRPVRAALPEGSGLSQSSGAESWL